MKPGRLLTTFASRIHFLDHVKLGVHEDPEILLRIFACHPVITQLVSVHGTIPSEILPLNFSSPIVPKGYFKVVKSQMKGAEMEHTVVTCNDIFKRI